MTLIERRQERARLIEASRKLLDKIDKERREFTAEETQEYERLETAADAAAAMIAREERLMAHELEMARTPAPTAPPEPRAEPTVPEIPERFRPYLRAALTDNDRAGLTLRSQPAYAELFRAALAGDGRRAQEFRTTLQADLFVKGGALVAPLEFVADLIQAVDNLTFVRGLATRYMVTQAEALGAPSLDTDASAPTWTSELLTGSEDAAIAFGRRELRPHPLAKRVKVSNKLLRASMMSVDAIVSQRVAYQYAVTQENAFLNGSGANQPLGVFTASVDGVTTARDVSTGNSATAIGADNLFEVKYSLKAQYWPRAAWIFHRDAVKMIRKLKDGNGQYLWAPGLSAGQPDRIVDSPFYVSEYAPNTFTSGLYVGILGDFSRYWIVDALDLTVQRLVELYAATNETGFVARAETDGAPVLAEAFARVKLG